ncbi:MAG: hypothetical protein EOM26_09200 [Alphaproteobacteria bacterium]|nr:hypothetical protein [Alphaproteobacteria bacterium]
MNNPDLQEKIFGDIGRLLEGLEGGAYTIQIVAVGSSSRFESEKTCIIKGRDCDGKKPSDWYDDRVYYL